MNRCTRCRQSCSGRVYDVTPRLRPSSFAQAPDFDDLIKPVEWAFSCANCLTDDEVAKLCSPVAEFVVERMLRRAADPRVAADGTAKAREINAENVKTLMRVRTKLRYEDGAGRSEKELAARARKSLQGDGRPYEASESFRQIKDSDNHIVRQAAYMIESGTYPAEEALTRVLLALAKSYDSAVDELVKLRSRMPLTFVVDDSVPVNEIRVREREPRDGFIKFDDAVRARTMNKHLNELMFGEVLAKHEARFLEWREATDYRHSPAPPNCAHCQQPSTELSYSLCPECVPCHSWFDGRGYVFEDVPFKKCSHLDRAQRRFICDVGTLAAYADGGKRLAELADVKPEPGGSAKQRDWIDKLEEELATKGLDPLVSEAILTAAYEVGLDETESAADTWVCINHPPGFEITYPATTATCEVCGTPKGE
jgi:hypothetical protein